MPDRDKRRRPRIGLEIAAEWNFGAAPERGFDELGRWFRGGQGRDEKDIKDKRDEAVARGLC